MSSTALSSVQFGVQAGNTNPPAAGPAPVLQPHYDMPEHTSLPLPGSSLTYTSAQRAAVWRRPQGISGSQQTYGTVFQPFAE